MQTKTTEIYIQCLALLTTKNKTAEKISKKQKKNYKKTLQRGKLVNKTK